jgi:hypothetical protein
MRLRVTFLAALVCLLLGSRATFAQQTGEIYGKVTDSSGAVLPGASVTISGGPLLQPLTAATSESGTYRFPQLLVGEYEVKIELAGFKTVVNSRIYVGINFNAQVNASMEVSTVQETVTVTSEAPIVDTRQDGTGVSFSNELLQAIPSGRDPWVMLQRTPGVAMDRENIGGSMSGQQSGYISRGASTGNNKWFVDGVDVTDQAATGASPVYFDFDTFDEMQVSTGGVDATQQTGGVGINIVTKSGTDVFRGSGRYYLTDDKFESNNISEELRDQNAGAGNPIQNIKDYGIEGGGPIWRSRAWFWGAYGKQDIKVGVINFYRKGVAGCPVNAADTATARALSIEELRECLGTDLTALDNYNMKGTAQVFRGNRATWHSYFADKKRNARDASDTRPIETALRQIGPVWTHKFSDQHVFSDRLLVDLQIAHVGGGFSLLLQDDALLDVQPSLDIPTGLNGRSFNASYFDRPADSVDLTATYFLPAKFGGDHAFKTGVRYRDTPSISSNIRGGSATARFRTTVAGGCWHYPAVAPPNATEAERATINANRCEADLYRNGYSDYGLTNLGFYLSDTYTRNKLTLNLGFRVDRQDDSVAAASVQSNSIVPEWLPALSFNGADSGVVWTDVSPRLGLTYDLEGDGKSVIKASYSAYYGQMGPGGISGIMNPVNEASIRFGWQDINRDGFIQRGELGSFTIGGSSLLRSDVITWGGNYNPNNPTALTTINRADPNIKNDRTREFIVGFDRQVGGALAFGAAYIWRKYDRFNWDNRYFTQADGVTPGDDWTSANYTAVNFTPLPTECQGAGAVCPTITYYNPTVQQPALLIRSNVPDRYRDFNGFEFTGRKRYSDRWMIDASVAYNNAVDVYASPAAYEDPTNIVNLNDAQYAPQSGGSGIDNIYTNSKWLVKVAGMYAMPWDIGLSAFYNARQGYPFPREVQAPARVNGAGTTQVYIEPLGDLRLPTFQNVDVRVAKSFRFLGKRKFDVSMDAFNLFNSDTVLGRRRNQRPSNANTVSAIVAPRVLRFGVRMEF